MGGKQREATLNNLNTLHRNTRYFTVLTSPFLLPGDPISQESMTSFFSNEGRMEIPMRERAGLRPCWVFQPGPESRSGCSQAVFQLTGTGTRQSSTFILCNLLYLPTWSWCM